MTATDRRTLHACASVFFTMIFWAGSGLVVGRPAVAQVPATATTPATPPRPDIPESPPPATPPAHDWGDRHSHVAPHVSINRGDRIRIGGSIVVEQGERADDVVAIFGDVIVRGDVRGDVVAVLGSVRVDDGASVGGSATAVGGVLEVARSAHIDGEATQVAVGWPGALAGESWRGDHFQFAPGQPWRWFANLLFVGTSVRIAVTMVLALLIAVVGGAAFRRQIDTIGAHPGETFIAGLGAEVLLPVAFVGLVVTLVLSIIGIPLLPLVPLLALVVGVVSVVGFAAATAALGRGALRLLGAADPSAVLSVLVGAIPVFLLTLISRAVWVSEAGFPGWSIGVALGGCLVEWLTWTFGLGTLALTWARRQGPSRAVAPPAAPVAPPPVPVEV